MRRLRKAARAHLLAQLAHPEPVLVQQWPNGDKVWHLPPSPLEKAQGDKGIFVRIGWFDPRVRKATT